jgi:RimJ/RimL family protein N-acetyltransferase
MSAVQLISQTDYRPTFPTSLRTARLVLRPFVAEDTDSIAALLSDPKAAQWIGGMKSQVEARESVLRMRDAFTQRGWGTLAVVPVDHGICVGYCGVRPLVCTPDVELAFALERSWWGNGYATEAATAALDAAFCSLRCESVVGTVYPENLASRRVLEKLGLRFEKEVFGYWPRELALLLRVTRKEWEQRASDR